MKSSGELNRVLLAKKLNISLETFESIVFSYYFFGASILAFSASVAFAIQRYLFGYIIEMGFIFVLLGVSIIFFIKGKIERKKYSKIINDKAKKNIKSSTGEN